MFEAKRDIRIQEEIDFVEEQVFIGLLAEDIVRSFLARREAGVDMHVLGTVTNMQNERCLEVVFSGSRALVASFLTSITHWRWDILHAGDGEVQ